MSIFFSFIPMCSKVLLKSYKGECKIKITNANQQNQGNLKH